jgi:hypothetical protein
MTQRSSEGMNFPCVGRFEGLRTTRQPQPLLQQIKLTETIANSCD